MKKMIRLLLPFACILLLNGCDDWDDLVDSVSGSGDDDETTVTNVSTVTTTTGTPPVAAEPEVESIPEATSYESRFHHTTTGSSDGGKSLVLCPGQVMGFEKCTSDGVSIPFHGYDTGRVIYWNMTKVPKGDINCVKDGKSYKYRADKVLVYGDC